MAYPPLVRQDGFQLPSPAQTTSTDDDRDDHLFMPHNIPFIPDSCRKFPTFPDEQLFDIAYHNDYLNSSIRYQQQQDTPAPRSRSRSRPTSVGPTRSARPDRRANSISSHVSSTSPPPRPHPHAILIPGRGNPIGGFFVQNGTSAPPDYNLPTPDSLSHSIIQHQFPYPTQPSSPYYPYQHINRPATPCMATNVDALNTMSINGISSLPSHIGSIPKSAPSSSPTKQLDPEIHLSEKRRRRRESHNAVERRRRDNINERIGELAGLIPGVLFECDGPLAIGSASDDLFTLGILGEPGIHVLQTEDGLPDLPEESMVKIDPTEDGEPLAPMSPTSPSIASGIAAITAANEQSTIKANKGMILRKSVEYIRYLQQLVSVQASRARDLEERNRALERELAMLKGEPPSSTSSSSPSLASSQALSMSSHTSASSGADSNAVERCGDDLEMDDACAASEQDESRGRRPGRARDKIHGMEM